MEGYRKERPSVSSGAEPPSAEGDHREYLQEEFDTAHRSMLEELTSGKIDAARCENYIHVKREEAAYVAQGGMFGSQLEKSSTQQTKDKQLTESLEAVANGWQAALDEFTASQS